MMIRNLCSISFLRLLGTAASSMFNEQAVCSALESARG